MNLPGLPHYPALDASGEAAAAATRMEARAREPASAAMFEALVRPWIEALPAGARVLEVGCGPGALSRRVAATRPDLHVCGTDKSVGMVEAARALASGSTASGSGSLGFAAWDVTSKVEPPNVAGRSGAFDLILSSVMLPYLDDATTVAVLGRLAGLLAAGGRIGLVEQDLTSDGVWFPDFDLWRRVFQRDARALKRTAGLGLRPVLRATGLFVEPVRSHLWQDRDYGPYLHDLLGAVADAARREGRITDDEQVTWGETLRDLAATGDFLYGIVYHGITGVRGPPRA